MGPYPRNNGEYLAALQAGQEKELKANEEAEAALAEELHREEIFRRKLQDEQENERQLAAKEASLPQEPITGNENAVTLLVRMPDGSRRGRRFLKTDNLQEVSTREKLLNVQPDLLQQFGMDLLPVLV
ncbi:hypothetical protein ACS0TY_017622 [Phlomoides rotata]